MPVLSAAILDDPREDLAELRRLLGGWPGSDGRDGGDLRPPDRTQSLLRPPPANEKPPAAPDAANPGAIAAF